MAIISFLVVTILSGFSAQSLATRKVAEKNIAIAVADLKMQELHKFNSGQLTPGITTEWVTHRDGMFKVFQSDPDSQGQLRRITSIAKEQGDVLGQKMVIQVMVEYGKTGNSYPFRVVLSTKRGS